MASRIAYLVSQYPAASHTFIRREIASLRAHGVAIDTFSIRRPSIGESSSDSDRVETEQTWYVLAIGIAPILLANAAEGLRHPIRYLKTLRLALRHRAPGAAKFVWALFHFLESIVLARELRQRGVCHLHNHFANAGATVGLLASAYLDLPWSLTLHGISETDYPAGLTLAAKIEAATFVACVSWFGRAQAMRITPPACWAKMEIVRCGVELGDTPSRPPSAALPDRPQIICVARLSPEKGLFGLLDAIKLLEQRGLVCDLVLVGDGPERSALESYSRQLNIGSRIVYSGRLDEQATLAAIGDADLLVLPSFMEGLPVVLMEAMALGIPVIASHVAGIPELIEDGVSGLLFRPADWYDLADKIEQMFADDLNRNRMVIAAREAVEREFDVRGSVVPLLRHFHAALPHPHEAMSREKGGSS